MSKNEGSANNNMIDDSVFQSLALLIQKGSKADVVKMLKKDKSNPHKKDLHGQSLLHVACESGNEDIVNLLIEKYKLEINEIDQLGWTPLHSACKEGHLAIAESLINKGAFVRAMTDQGSTPLHYLARNKDDNPLLVHRVINLLIKKGNSVDIKNRLGETPLHIAASFGRQQYLLYLINCKADLNSLSLGGETPLKYAIKAGKTNCVEILLKMGAKIEDSVEAAMGWSSSEEMIALLRNWSTRSSDLRSSNDLRSTLSSMNSPSTPDQKNDHSSDNSSDPPQKRRKTRGPGAREMFRLQISSNSANFKSHKHFNREEKKEEEVEQPLSGRKRSNSISHFSPRDIIDAQNLPPSTDHSSHKSKSKETKREKKDSSPSSDSLSEPSLSSSDKPSNENTPNNSSHNNANNNSHNNNNEGEKVEKVEKAEKGRVRKTSSSSIQERIKKLQLSTNEEKEEGGGRGGHGIQRTSSAEASVVTRIKHFEISSSSPPSSQPLSKRIEQFKKGVIEMEGGNQHTPHSLSLSPSLSHSSPSSSSSPPPTASQGGSSPSVKDRKAGSKSHSALPISPITQRKAKGSSNQKYKSKSAASSDTAEGEKRNSSSSLSSTSSSSDSSSPSPLSASQPLPSSFLPNAKSAKPSSDLRDSSKPSPDPSNNNSNNNIIITAASKKTITIMCEQLIAQLCGVKGELKGKMANEGMTRCRNRCPYPSNPLPLLYFCQNPYQYDLLAEDEKDVRSQISADLCSIDNLQFFVRGLIELPILLPSFDRPADENSNLNSNQENENQSNNNANNNNNNEDLLSQWTSDVEKEKEKVSKFIWGVWVKLECSDFFKVMDGWKENKCMTMQGILSSQLPMYDQTLNVPVTISTRPDGLRPSVSLHQPSSHPLALEQLNGISIFRLASILSHLLSQNL